MLEIFPERLLDSSIHTAILVGLIVAWAGTERLGWVFAGYIVPGYLAAIAIVHPMSLVATVVEAVLTYGIVWALGVGASRLRLWNLVFGRERFLLFVLVSVPVRLVVEGGAAPQLQVVLQPWFSAPAWAGGQFFSIGLVLVPLLANAFWKVGLSAGALQVGLNATATWAVLVWVVMPLTNFHLGKFELTFESLALDFIYLPKINLILLVTALVAARNNLRYGWDYNGILVPSLLAIIAFTPIKLAVTVVEVVALVWVYRGLMSIPLLARINLQGPRRIVSMYLVSYGLKYVVALVLEVFLPSVHIPDMFGFGYLLTSLVAVRCYEKQDTLRTLMPVLFTTGQGFALGSVLALAVAFLTAPGLRPGALFESTTAVEQTSLDRAMVRAHGSVRRSPIEQTLRSEERQAAMLGEFRRLSAHPEASEAVIRRWTRLGLHVEWAGRADGRQCLGVRERRQGMEEPAGLPMLWWCGGDGPGLMIPHPLSDPDALWTAAYLAQHGDFSGVVVAGVDNPNRATEREWFASRNLLRHHLLIRRALGERTVLLVESRPAGASSLEPKSRSAALPLDAMRELLPSLEFRFRGDHGSVQWLWEELPAADALLTVSAADLDVALTPVADPGPVPLDEVLSELALGDLRRGSGVYQPGTPEERLAYAGVGLRVAMRRARSHEGPSAVPPGLAYLTGLFDGELRLARGQDGEPLWVIADKPAAPRGWGQWVVRPLARSRWVVEVPRSVDEPGTSAVGQSVFNALDAQALWVSGSETSIDLSGVGDGLGPLDADLPVEQLAVLSALRASGALGSSLVMVRRRPTSFWALEDVVISVGQETVVEEEQERVLDALGSALSPWQSIGFDDNRLATRSLVSGSFFPVRYKNSLFPYAAVVIWVAPELLGEVPGWDKQRRLEWYATVGYPVVDAASVEPLLARVDLKDPLDQDELLELMVLHMRTGAEAPLPEIHRRSGGRVQVVDAGLRLHLIAWGGGWLCRASRDSTSGCWGLR